MTARQAQIAATIISAISASQTDVPDEINGLSKSDVSNIVAAINRAGRKTLKYHEYNGPLSKEGAVQFALDNF